MHGRVIPGPLLPGSWREMFQAIGLIQYQGGWSVHQAERVKAFSEGSLPVQYASSSHRLVRWWAFQNLYAQNPIPAKSVQLQPYSWYHPSSCIAPQLLSDDRKVSDIQLIHNPLCALSLSCSTQFP